MTDTKAITQPGPERQALQRGASVHLRSALEAAAKWVEADTAVRAAVKNRAEWRAEIDGHMLAFNQFRLSLDEVRKVTPGPWGLKELEAVTASLDTVSRGTYGQETAEHGRWRERRRDALELDDHTLRERALKVLTTQVDRIWERGGRQAAAELIADHEPPERTD